MFLLHVVYIVNCICIVCCMDLALFYKYLFVRMCIFRIPKYNLASSVSTVNPLSAKMDIIAILKTNTQFIAVGLDMSPTTRPTEP